MHQHMIVVVLIGLVVSTYGLDLSHAGQNPKKLDPQTVRLVANLYTETISQPINHLFTHLAILGTNLFAALSQNGIHTADGRTVHPSEEQLRGFFSGLWNDALKPPLENALTGISLMLAQVLAGVGTEGINLGIGKRDLTDAELRGFFDALGQAVSDVFANVIQKPLEDALAGGALMLAQVLAGAGTNGINLSNLLGKRDVMDLSGHEDELRGIFGTIGGAVVNGLTGVWNNVFQLPLENFVQNTALTAAGWLATLGTEGVNLGKRDAMDLSGHEDELRGIFGTIGGAVVNGLTGVWNNVFQLPLENFVQNTALTAAGWLATLGTEGVNLGKRSTDARGAVFDSLFEHATGLYTNQVKPIVENALNAAAIHLAGVLANLSQNVIGRR